MGTKDGKLFACAQCGLEAREKETGQKFCSRACKHAASTGVELVKGTRYVRPDGYVAVKVGVRRYELEHRMVAERLLGRKLMSAEHVHHVNGVKADNRPENLRVMSNDEHQRLHDWSLVKSTRVKLTCKRCGAEYERKASRVAGSNYCSAACRLEVQHAAARAYHARRRAEKEA